MTKAPPFKPPNLDFLQQTGPAGYVAGSLRNDKGFSLRPDMGPIDLPGNKLDDHGLFAPTTAASRTAEDEEADEIYNQIEERRRRKRTLVKSGKAAREQKESREEGVFGDLKPELERVSAEEWASIPEASDFRIKKLKRLGNYQDPKAKDRFIPLPDNLLSVGSIGYDLQAEGFQEPDGDEAEEDKLLRAGEAREAALGLALDSAEKSLGKGTAPSVRNDSNSNSAVVGDPDKARHILRNLLRTNPQVPSAWLAAARLEHSQGKLKLARHLLSQGCGHCPDDADLWIEAVRLATDKPALLERALASEAAHQHASLWLEALRHQKTIAARRKLLQTALGLLPKSVQLWEEYLAQQTDAEEREDGLEAAVQCAPTFAFFVELAQMYLNRDLQRAMALCNEAAACAVTVTEQYRLSLLTSEINERISSADLPPSTTEGSLEELDPNWFIQAEKRGSARTVHRFLSSKPFPNDVELLAKFISSEAWECAKTLVLLNPTLLNQSLFPETFFEYLLESSDCSVLKQAVFDAWYRQNPTVLTRAFQSGLASEQMWIDHLLQSNSLDQQAYEQARKAYPQSTRLILLQAQAILNGQITTISNQNTTIPNQNSAAMDFIYSQILENEQSADLWLFYGELVQDKMQVYKEAVEKCPESAELWIRYSQTMPSVHRARAILDIARRKLSNHSEQLKKLLLYCVEFEGKNGNESGLKAAKQHLSQFK